MAALFCVAPVSKNTTITPEWVMQSARITIASPRHPQPLFTGEVFWDDACPPGMVYSIDRSKLAWSRD